MEKHFKIICLITLVLLVITIPAAAIPSVIDSGVSTYGKYQELVAAKDTWKTSDEGKTPDGNIAAWIRIPPRSDLDWWPAGCTPGASGCTGMYQYYHQYRVFTPDGKDWYKDIVGLKDTYNVGSSKVVLTQPSFFWGVDSAHQNVGEYGGALLSTSQLQPRHYSGKTYQFPGRWAVEIYIHDVFKEPRQSTLVKTLYFNIVDDSAQATTLPTTSPYNVPVSATTTPITPPTYVIVSATTTPITPPSNQKIIIEGEKYVDANVQKTGATWDSVEEKCPTWRGNDWSGTGDYYLSHGGDTLTYLITAPATGKYVMWMRDWSDTNHAAGDRQVTITIDGSTIGTFDAASSFNKGTTGYGWDQFTTVNLGAGSHTMKITKKDTTSSAAIIDDLWFSSNLNEIPQGYTTHSEALCSASVTTPITPTIYCTPPPCSSGKYVCLQKDGCSGGCGMSCDNSITPAIPVGGSGCSGTGTSVYAEDRTMQQGSTVKIPIMVCNANDLANMDLVVNYDTSVLKFRSAEKGGLNANSLFESNEVSPGTIMISFASSTGASGSASIALLTFDVIGSNGSTSPIKITVKTASTSSGSAIPVTVSQGTFTTGTPNKVTFDGGPVTSRDALAALQMAVGKIPTDTKYDVTKDGSVNSADARAILKIAVSSQ